MKAFWAVLLTLLAVAVLMTVTEALGGREAVERLAIGAFRALASRAWKGG